MLKISERSPFFKLNLFEVMCSYYVLAKLIVNFRAKYALLTYAVAVSVHENCYSVTPWATLWYPLSISFNGFVYFLSFSLRHIEKTLYPLYNIKK